MIKIHLLKSGMVLAEEVQNHVGQKLLPEGIQLTEKHILNLKTWGVTEVNIQGDESEIESAQGAENIDPKKLAKAEKEAQLLFRHSNQDHPVVAELMWLFCLNRLQRTPETGDIDAK